TTGHVGLGGPTARRARVLGEALPILTQRRGVTRFGRRRLAPGRSGIVLIVGPRKGLVGGGRRVIDALVLDRTQHIRELGGDHHVIVEDDRGRLDAGV